MNVVQILKSHVTLKLKITLINGPENQIIEGRGTKLLFDKLFLSNFIEKILLTSMVRSKIFSSKSNSSHQINPRILYCITFLANHCKE